MKGIKILLTTTILLFCFCGFAQEYSLEPDGRLSFSKVIFSKDSTATRENLYNIIQSYFSYYYNDGKSVIQTANPEEGYIIGNGYYVDFYNYTNSAIGRKGYYSSQHIIRVDCKDGRIRVIVTVNMYSIHVCNWVEYDQDVSISEEKISALYPIVPQENIKKLTKSERRSDEAFKSLVARINSQFDKIEETIQQKGGSIIQTEDW
jgi:hypothetical protein